MSKPKLIIHVRSGVLQGIDKWAAGQRQRLGLAKETEYEIWDHDECDKDEEAKANCPECRDPTALVWIVREAGAYSTNEKEKRMTHTPEPQICPHCHGDITIRSPHGLDVCDHLYYPDSCAVCRKREARCTCELH